MKQTLLLLFIVLVLLSCDKKDGGNYPYHNWSMAIENRSTHVLRLKFYSYLTPIVNVDTTLSINQNYILTKGNEDPLGSGPDLISSGIFDSAVVIFDDGKKLVYTHNKALGVLNDSVNNLLLKGNYLSGSISGNNEVFIYFFDDSDYQRAEK